MAMNFWSPIKLSIEITIISGILATVLGIIIGKIMANRTFKGKAIVETIFLLPLVLPPTVVGFLLIIIFGRYSLIGQLIEFVFGQPVMFTSWAAIIASTVVAFPLMYQSTKASFANIDSTLEDAARTLGANELRVFLTVTLPMGWHGILAGLVLSFSRALGEFGATIMVAGNIPGKTQTLPLAIYFAAESNDLTMAGIYVLIISLITFSLIFWLNIWTKSKGEASLMGGIS
jgi:molybdate transport system permease protein